MYDLIIDNALLCDGTGAAAVMGSLAVQDGRIAAQGALGGAGARQRIDADGRVLSPGFIDPHTHYDAQLAWDPLVTCSPLHGVTTVLFGNCGVGVAPVHASMREQVMLDLVGVEGIALDVMKQGIAWRWETWGQYLDALDGSGLGINVAGLLAYTPLRHFVMGAQSRERAATDSEIDAMTAIFRTAMDEGVLGDAAPRTGPLGRRPAVCSGRAAAQAPGASPSATRAGAPRECILENLQQQSERRQRLRRLPGHVGRAVLRRRAHGPHVRAEVLGEFVQQRLRHHHTAGAREFREDAGELRFGHQVDPRAAGRRAQLVTHAHHHLGAAHVGTGLAVELAGQLFALHGVRQRALEVQTLGPERHGEQAGVAAVLLALTHAGAGQEPGKHRNVLEYGDDFVWPAGQLEGVLELHGRPI
jgi:hypothetical protein